MPRTDRLFENKNIGHGEFQFDESVASVFDDMIERSVPLYAEVQDAVPRLAKLLDHTTIRVIDLGCSTGTSLGKLLLSPPAVPMELIGVDNSASMLKRCREKLTALRGSADWTLIESDISEFELGETSIVLMNYTMQFIPIDARLSLLRRIWESLKPGGFLVFSEKFSNDDVMLDKALFELYFDYKRQNGYSELEIARKRDALENVLVPFSVQENQAMLIRAGFQAPELLLKWFNFGTFLCMK